MIQIGLRLEVVEVFKTLIECFPKSGEYKVIPAWMISGFPMTFNLDHNQDFVMFTLDGENLLAGPNVSGENVDFPYAVYSMV